MILFQISTVVPVYFFLLIAVVAAFLSWLLYRHSNIESARLRMVLRVLRFLGIALTLVLLMAPIVKFKTIESRKPVVLVYKDVSYSIDSAKGLPANALENAVSKLNDKFDIRFFEFAAEVSQDSVKSRGSTNVASVFDHANELSVTRNVSAVLLASDGIYNAGVNPVFKNPYKSVPFFVLGLGDTTRYPDLRVQSVLSNTSVYFGNEFVLECVLRSISMPNAVVDVQLLENGRLLQSKKWNSSGNLGLGKLEFVIKPGSTGKVKYEVRISAGLNEKNTNNNSGFAYVDVTDTKRKIALVSHAPNPDIAAILRSLKLRSEYEITQFSSPAFPNSEQFDLIVTHGLPANQAESNFLKSVVKSAKPSWQIWSLQVVPSLFPYADLGFQMSAAQGSMNEVQAHAETGFNEYALDSEWLDLLPQLPPLKSLYGNYRSGPGVIKMLSQKIGAVNTSYPLLSFVQQDINRHAFLFGEGLWKWRLRTFAETGEFVSFDDWISQIIQFISSGEQNKRFRSFTTRAVYEPADNVVITAEYLDKNLKPDNRSDCEVEIIGEGGLKKKLPFSKANFQYRVDAGVLPSGEYTFTSKLLSSEKMTDGGRFTVLTSELEKKNTEADHQLLRNIARKTGGEFRHKNEMDSLVASLGRIQNAKPVLVEKEKVLELIHVKWLLFVIVLVFAAEWFIRRWTGGY